MSTVPSTTGRSLWLTAVSAAWPMPCSPNSFSVTTVSDCGMSRNAWLPLPMLVVVARSASLPSGASAFSRTTTGARLFSWFWRIGCAQVPAWATL